MEFKVGDKVNCNRDEDGWREWQNATIVAIDDEANISDWCGITCVCDAFHGEKGLFWEKELDLIIPTE